MSDTTHGLSLGRRLPNAWDLAAILCVFGLIIGLVKIAPTAFVKLNAPGATEIHLDPSYLPYYAARTTLRMFAALAASLFFTFTYAAVAAKSRRAELVMIPILDVLQSVPILGFLTFTTVFFMSIFPGQVAGLELAAIFAIFTSQAWNMAFSLYQSLKTLPGDLDEAARSFRLSGWQKFWRLEAPFAMPGLIWNMMLSMSGGWFFVVASEAISVGDNTWKLPGIGSYVATALDQRDFSGILWAILAMAVVIVLYDQLLFRPLTAWATKFRFETVAGAEGEDPWMLKVMRRTRLMRAVGDGFGGVFGYVTGLPLGGVPRVGRAWSRTGRSRLGDVVFAVIVAGVAFYGVREIVDYVTQTLGWSDLGETALLGVYTMIRVVILMALATVIWVPISVWVGLRPNWARRVQPAAQFMAAFPANLFFPIFVIAIVHWHLNPDIWLTPLIVLGTQWYIVFNVIAGAAAFPTDLREVAANFRIGGWRWWQKVMIPGIFPYFITGAITASGGSWNASIVAEVASWGNDKVEAHGIGAYIADATTAGDMAKVILGVAVLSAFVLVFNRGIWRPMYAYAVRRTTLG